MRQHPDGREDAKNLSLIVGSGLVAVVVTAGFLGAGVVKEQARVVRFEFDAPVRAAPAATIPAPPVVAADASNRLYGRVVTRDGRQLTGFVRWDRNEGSWSDLLDATKRGARRGSGTLSGIRFGHLRRIDVTGRQSARFTLKSGDEVEMGARATDLGTGLRALLVEDPAGGTAELEWNDLESVEFIDAPADVRPAEDRLHGTLTTRSGQEFTGYIAWDVDEIYTSDVLDGEANGQDQKIEFGAIESIERAGRSAAHVVLRDGRELTLRGTNDVDASNGGISVSDPGLGQVKVSWDNFSRVRFHRADEPVGYDQFDGGHALAGTVITGDGEERSGSIIWDNDEASSWEMLNGDSRGAEFNVEFGNIASIRKARRGAQVTLRDGRSYLLHGSNDVNGGNRGILIRTGGRTHEVDWDDFAELRLKR